MKQGEAKKKYVALCDSYLGNRYRQEGKVYRLYPSDVEEWNKTKMKDHKRFELLEDFDEEEREAFEGQAVIEHADEKDLEKNVIKPGKADILDKKKKTGNKKAKKSDDILS